ncbi:MAG: hypothetical protein ABIJ42_10640 [Acidobacteriota bacterium]
MFNKIIGSTSSVNQQGRWRDLFFRKSEVWKTTWMFRLLLIFLLGACFFITRGCISEELAESLVYRGIVIKSDAVIIENFDPNYLLFEETAKLVKAGQASRVFVPVSINGSGTGPNRVSQGFVEVMSRLSRIGSGYELIPVAEIEPIRLNAAQQIKNHLQDKGVQSIIVVSPGFSSKRSFLVYQSVFESTDIEVRCLPVFGDRNPANWSDTWHGVQEVFLEFGKLWYYKIVVLD